MVKNKYILGLLGFILSIGSTYACINDSFSLMSELAWGRRYSSTTLIVTLVIIFILIFTYFLFSIIKSRKEKLTKNEVRNTYYKSIFVLILGFLFIFFRNKLGFPLLLSFMFFYIYYPYVYFKNVKVFLRLKDNPSKLSAGRLKSILKLYIVTFALMVVTFGSLSIGFIVLSIFTLYTMGMVILGIVVLGDYKFKTFSLSVLFMLCIFRIFPIFLNILS